MSRRNKYYKLLQAKKDELICKTIADGFGYGDTGWIFGITKQGAWKAEKRFIDRQLKIE